MEALSCYGCGASWHSAAATVWAEGSCPGCGGQLKAARYLLLDVTDHQLDGRESRVQSSRRFHPAPNPEAAA
jgi:hypothetical protein